jgi:hypothetical protein
MPEGLMFLDEGPGTAIFGKGAGLRNDDSTVDDGRGLVERWVGANPVQTRTHQAETCADERNGDQERLEEFGKPPEGNGRGMVFSRGCERYPAR